MTCLKLTLPMSATVPAPLTLPRPLTAQALRELEHAVAVALALLGRDLFGSAVGTARAHAADIEYASWLPDPGALEVDSWAAHMRAAAR